MIEHTRALASHRLSRRSTRLPGAMAYGVVKGTLPHFARVLARELADHNIRVNCVSPGVIRTPFQDHLTSAQVENNIRTGFRSIVKARQSR